MKRSQENKRPFKVFRELSDPIKAEFVKLADITARKFKPVGIETQHVLDLCVNKSDQSLLSEAWHACRQRIEPGWNEEMRCIVAGEGLVSDVEVTFRTLREGGGLEDYILRPDYAANPTAPIESAPPELSAKMADEINQWIEIVRDITMAREVFTHLDDQYPNRSREQLRYVFPAVVPLLRRVAVSAGYRDTPIGKEAAKWAANLANPLPVHHWSPDPTIRAALQHANSVVAMVSLYDDTPYVRKPHQSDIKLRMRPNLMFHPLWPMSSLDLLGLSPS